MVADLCYVVFRSTGCQAKNKKYETKKETLRHGTNQPPYFFIIIFFQKLLLGCTILQPYKQYMIYKSFDKVLTIHKPLNFSK
jgi:hypothetical protein